MACHGGQQRTDVFLQIPAIFLGHKLEENLLGDVIDQARPGCVLERHAFDKVVLGEEGLSGVGFVRVHLVLLHYPQSAGKPDKKVVGLEDRGHPTMMGHTYAI